MLLAIFPIVGYRLRTHREAHPAAMTQKLCQHSSGTAVCTLRGAASPPSDVTPPPSLNFETRIPQGLRPSKVEDPSKLQRPKVSVHQRTSSYPSTAEIGPALLHGLCISGSSGGLAKAGSRATAYPLRS